MRWTQLALAIALGSLATACGAEDSSTQTRQPNNSQTLPPTIGPQTDPTPPRDMPGGGRGSDPPHTKGKP